jgi:hypothetical protein
MVHPLRLPVEFVVSMLVNGEWEELEKATGGIRLRGVDIARAVRQYGRKLVDPPREAYDTIDAILIKDAIPPQWSVRMKLWTAEEGVSDLTLELTLIQANNNYRIELDDIHVL